MADTICGPHSHVGESWALQFFTLSFQLPRHLTFNLSTFKICRYIVEVEREASDRHTQPKTILPNLERRDSDMLIEKYHKSDPLLYCG